MRRFNVTPLASGLRCHCIYITGTSDAGSSDLWRVAVGVDEPRRQELTLLPKQVCPAIACVRVAAAPARQATVAQIGVPGRCGVACSATEERCVTCNRTMFAAPRSCLARRGSASDAGQIETITPSALITRQRPSAISISPYTGAWTNVPMTAHGPFTSVPMSVMRCCCMPFSQVSYVIAIVTSPLQIQSESVHAFQAAAEFRLNKKEPRSERKRIRSSTGLSGRPVARQRIDRARSCEHGEAPQVVAVAWAPRKLTPCEAEAGVPFDHG